MCFQACDPYKICTRCADHPAASPYESCKLGEVRGWGEANEPLSASQAVIWGQRSPKEWGSIFGHALEERAEFSKTSQVVPVYGRIPQFDCYLDGKVDCGTLRASAVIEWEVRTSVSGLMTPSATTSSRCLLAIESPMGAYFDNNYPDIWKGRLTCM